MKRYISVQVLAAVKAPPSSHPVDVERFDDADAPKSSAPITRRQSGVEFQSVLAESAREDSVPETKRTA